MKKKKPIHPGEEKLKRLHKIFPVTFVKVSDLIKIRNRVNKNRDKTE